MRLGDTPVPIPNTMVKPWAADGTALETVWESRWPPDFEKKDPRGKTGSGLKDVSWKLRNTGRKRYDEGSGVLTGEARDCADSLSIDTGKGRPQPADANPTSREVLF